MAKIGLLEDKAAPKGPSARTLQGKLNKKDEQLERKDGMLQRMKERSKEVATEAGRSGTFLAVTAAGSLVEGRVDEKFTVIGGKADWRYGAGLLTKGYGFHQQLKGKSGNLAHGAGDAFLGLALGRTMRNAGAAWREKALAKSAGVGTPTTQGEPKALGDEAAVRKLVRDVVLDPETAGARRGPRQRHPVPVGRGRWTRAA